MTNEQLYLAIGVPAALQILGTACLMGYINSKFAGLHKQFDRFNGKLNDSTTDCVRCARN